jgi:hypothetical protein
MVIIGCCIVGCSKLWPHWYALLPLLLIPLLVYRIVSIFRLNHRERVQKISDKKLESEFVEWYHNNTHQHHNLFEEIQVESSPVDRNYMKKWRLINCSIIFSITLLVGIPLVVFLWDDPVIHSLAYGIFGIGGVLTLVVWFYYSRITHKGLKTVVRGVLTRKSFHIGYRNESFNVEISEKISVPVSEKEYYAFTFGDILETEWLGNISYEGRKIKRIGKLDFKPKQN